MRASGEGGDGWGGGEDGEVSLEETYDYETGGALWSSANDEGGQSAKALVAELRTDLEQEMGMDEAEGKEP